MVYLSACLLRDADMEFDKQYRSEQEEEVDMESENNNDLKTEGLME